MSKPIDLTGQRFGMLTVQKASDQRTNGAMMWECQCDCGSDPVVIAGFSLRGGNTRSCGCLRKQNGRKRTADLTGKRFGRLTVTGELTERRGGAIMWACQCDCGNTTKASTGNLNGGFVRSCGCLKTGRPQKVSFIMNQGKSLQGT